MGQGREVLRAGDVLAGELVPVVIKGVLELGRVPSTVITAFRIPGSWEDEGVAILRHYGIAFFDRRVSFDQVVEQIVREG